MGSDKPHRFSRNGETHFDFRTDRYPFDISSQCFLEIVVELVSPIVADLLPKQAGADSKFYLVFHVIVK